MFGKTNLQKVFFHKSRHLLQDSEQRRGGVLSERLRQANGLNDEHLEKIMELDDLLVKHTGKTVRGLGGE